MDKEGRPHGDMWPVFVLRPQFINNFQGNCPFCFIAPMCIWGDKNGEFVSFNERV